MNLGLTSHKVLEFEKKLFCSNTCVKMTHPFFSQCVNPGFSERFLDASV